jgi:hypothetical protein
MNEPKVSFQDIFLVMKILLCVNSAYNTRRSAAKITIWKCVRQIHSSYRKITLQVISVAPAWVYSVSPNECLGNVLQNGMTSSFKISKYSPLILTFDFYLMLCNFRA